MQIESSRRKKKATWIPAFVSLLLLCWCSSSLSSAICSLHFALCALCFVLCTLHFVLCTLHFTFCNLYFVIFTLCSALCTLHFVQCTLHFALGNSLVHRPLCTSWNSTRVKIISLFPSLLVTLSSLFICIRSLPLLSSVVKKGAWTDVLVFAILY